MTQDDGNDKSLVVFCGCAYYDVIPEATKHRVFGSLRAAGVEVEAVADLCGLAAQRDARLGQWAKAKSLAIVACFPRAIRSLFRAASVSLDADRVQFFNMRTESPDEILARLLDGHSSQQTPTSVALPEKADGWIPWFPVIDYDRCKNCKQCMNFCLFGTYGLSPEGRVEVQAPSACKTNCPACARICPANAIIFPKYGESPINGDQVTESSGSKDKPAPDLRSLLKGNVYDKIRNRQPGRKRFSTDPKDATDKAPASSLAGLKRELGIPDDVLASLSPAELHRIRKKSQSETEGTE